MSWLRGDLKSFFTNCNIVYIKDERVKFGRRMANKYMKIANDPQIVHGMNVLDNLSLNKLYTLASAPEENIKFTTIFKI